ncbi:hypothetical protein OPKNFCMD_6087 [Methylobacterium crusticola]|uniref:DUF3551 domain-containing protein n=1 Tax=Methylobacterium crusticola TaxID=1697972 RepID=A0ABQ4R7C3_9HYPH|nr:hypothetical protein [Methylobacterium crusticola]GJD53312.1 hypothetical protein OPKNFCMD_6087 [Methylobacterium crusticola]
MRRATRVWWLGGILLLAASGGDAAAGAPDVFWVPVDPSWLPHLPACAPAGFACDMTRARLGPSGCTWRRRPTPEGPRRVRICF